MKKQKTSFEHIANLWDEKIGDTIPSKAFSNTSGSMKITIDTVIRMLGNLKGKRVYEPACGNGHLSRYFVKKGAKKVFASDASKKLIALAQKKYSSDNIAYSTRPATNFRGIPHNFFDAVIVHQGIFYIKNLDALMKGVYKTLRKGGIFIFTLTHPLYAVAQADMKLSGVQTMLKKSRNYLKNRLVLIKKEWGVNGKKEMVSYWQYQRPLSIYINACGKHRLYVSEVSEPSTRVKKNGKVFVSAIPSSIIVKAIKM